MVSNAGCSRVTQSHATRRICDRPQALVTRPARGGLSHRASGSVQFNVRTLNSIIITIHPSNVIVPMIKTATSQRNLTSGTLSCLAGSERGMGVDIGEANGLPGRLVVARSPALSVVGVDSDAVACIVDIAGTDILLSRGPRWRLRAISFIGMAPIVWMHGLERWPLLGHTMAPNASRL